MKEGGVPASSAPGVSYQRMENGAAVFTVGSGTYQFTSADAAMAPSRLNATATNGKVALNFATGQLPGQKYTAVNGFQLRLSAP